MWLKKRIESDGPLIQPPCIITVPGTELSLNKNLLNEWAPQWLPMILFLLLKFKSLFFSLWWPGTLFGTTIMYHCTTIFLSKSKSLVHSAISYTVDHEFPQERFIGCLLCSHHWREVGPLKNSRGYLLHSSEAEFLSSTTLFLVHKDKSERLWQMTK